MLVIEDETTSRLFLENRVSHKKGTERKTKARGNDRRNEVDETLMVFEMGITKNTHSWNWN